MKQSGLIIKLIIGIALGVIIGTFAGDWVATKWLISVMVFGKTFLKDIIQFFLPLIMITFLSVGIADLGRISGQNAKMDTWPFLHLYHYCLFHRGYCNYYLFPSIPRFD